MDRKPLTEFKKILVIRPDRIGDVILSIPVLKTLKKKYPHAELTFLVQPFLAPLLEGLKCVDAFIYFDPKEAQEFPWETFKKMTQVFRDGHYDGVIHLQSHFLLAASAYFAGIPFRVGPYSKVFSYLFYNQGKKQKRSQVLQHEAEYNLDLLERFGVQKNEYDFETEVFISQSVRENVSKKISEFYPHLKSKKIILMHPGMRGSALNWPIESYKKLAHYFLKEGMSVFVTAGKTEQWVLEAFQKKCDGIDLTDYIDQNLIFWGGIENPLCLDELAALMENVDVVVAPSTGPLHMAVALKKKVISFYPNIRVQSQKRWGPFFKKDQHKMSLVHTPAEGSNKMEKILVEDVIRQIEKNRFF